MHHDWKEHSKLKDVAACAKCHLWRVPKEYSDSYYKMTKMTWIDPEGELRKTELPILWAYTYDYPGSPVTKKGFIANCTYHSKHDPCRR